MAGQTPLSRSNHTNSPNSYAPRTKQPTFWELPASAQPREKKQVSPSDDHFEPSNQSQLANPSPRTTSALSALPEGFHQGSFQQSSVCGPLDNWHWANR
jgi:hypothetical protein